MQPIFTFRLPVGLLLAILVGASTALSAPRPAVAATPASLPDWPWYRQAYPLDCEAASEQMVLRYEGFATSQGAILSLMGDDARAGYYDANGTLRWGNANQVFVGSVSGSETALTGYGTYAPVVARVARAINGGLVLSSGTGLSPSNLYTDVAAGDPVQVWVTWKWVQQSLGHWLTFDGTTWIPYAGPGEHSVDVIGVSDTQVLIADPMGGAGDAGHPSPVYWLSKSTFEAAYATYQDMAVVYAPLSAGLGWARYPGSAHDVAFGGSTLIVIGTDVEADGYGVWRWDGSNWIQYPGSGARIAVDPQGHPWIVNSQQAIWHWDGANWQSVPGPPDPANPSNRLGATDIGVGGDGSVFLIATNSAGGGNGIWKLTGTTWQQYPGGGVRVSVDSSGNPWVVNSTQQIWSWSGGSWVLQPGGGVDVGAGVVPWIASNQAAGGGDTAEELSGGQWWSVGGGVTNVAVGTHGELYATNDAFGIYEHLSI